MTNMAMGKEDNMKILALGISCVDVYPQKSIVTPGGEALNAAVHLSCREDVEVYLMGLLGNDTYAEIILDQIARFNIRSDYMYQTNGETAHHVIHINPRGDRYFTDGSWHGGVCLDFRLNGHDRNLLADIDGVMMTLHEPNLKELLTLKREKHYVAAVDFNDQRDFTGWEEVIEDIDIFFLSAEASMKESFQERSETHDTIFVLTFGEDGSVAYHKGQVFTCPAAKVAHVIDTTGCGDCYQAHFVAEYLKTTNISVSMKRAALEAAKVTAYVGGFPANAS